MKQQVVHIHGGGEHIGTARDQLAEKLKNKEVDIERFRRKESWSSKLQERLGEDYDVLAPRMPVADDPKYKEWEAWFGNFSKLLSPDAVYIGHSLGGIFLIKYFSEHTDIEAKSIFIVAAPYVSDDPDWGMTGFSLPETFSLPNSLGEKITFYHSEDDVVVPIDNLNKYKAVAPTAIFKYFKDRNHFFEDNLPEIIEDIKSL